jgi:S1-C subfamily serine protease
LALTAIIVSGIFSGGGILILQQIEPLRLAARLEKQLGMKTEREFAQLDDQVVEVLRVKSLASGLPADQAGLKIGDQIRPLPSINEFYKNLNEHRGEDVDFTVYRGGSLLNKLDELTELEMPVSIPLR